MAYPQHPNPYLMQPAFMPVGHAPYQGYPTPNPLPLSPHVR